MSEPKLTPKQKAFCDYYIETLNATESAKRAGYSEKTAREMGTENLSKPLIRAYIDKILAEKDNERIASQDEVLQFLTSMMRGEIHEEVVATDDFKPVIVTKKAQPKDRIKAGELLAKRYGLDKSQIEVMAQVVINDDI